MRGMTLDEIKADVELARKSLRDIFEIPIGREIIVKVRMR
jgi:hypothetical protein